MVDKLYDEIWNCPNDWCTYFIGKSHRGFFELWCRVGGPMTRVIHEFLNSVKRIYAIMLKLRQLKSFNFGLS